MRKILLYIFLLGAFFLFFNGNAMLPGGHGKLSGTVTFKESYGSPKRADPGSQIYAISEADLRSTPYANIAEVIEIFRDNKTAYLLSTYKTIDPDETGRLQSAFDDAAEYTWQYLTGFRKLPAIIWAATDGAGNYTLNLPPGRYYILFVSGSVKSDNKAELKGNIDCRNAEIKPGGSTILNTSFEKKANIMMMLITSHRPEGC